MKLRYTLIVSIIMVMMLIGVAYSNNKQVQSIATANKTLQQAKAELTAQRNANDRFINEYNSLWEQCEKGINAYNLLPVASKTPLAMPNCGLSITQ